MSEVKYTVDFSSVISCTVDEVEELLEELEADELLEELDELLEELLDELPVEELPDELPEEELDELPVLAVVELSADELPELLEELPVEELLDEPPAETLLDELSEETSSGGKTRGASLPVFDELHAESPKATITLRKPIDNFFIKTSYKIKLTSKPVTSENTITKAM